MARMLWLNWSGGGNLPPSLGVARALSERGHAVAFAGRPEMVSRVKAAGFRPIELTQAYAQVDRYPTGTPLTRAACYLTSPAVGAELRSLIAQEAPDVLLVDGMFPAALLASRHFDGPVAVFCHTFFFRLLDEWRRIGALFGGMYERAGFGTLPGLDELWSSCDRVIVTTSAEFDGPSVAGWESVRHVGPVLEDENCAVRFELPWGAQDTAPLVLVSFSTGFEQRSVDKLQHTLDALAPLRVRVVATTGGIVAPEELATSDNAIVLEYAQHDAILERASLVVTHGGHGTAMRSLKHGVPMIVMPGLAHDQSPIAQAIQKWGAGVALPPDTPAEAIRAAALEILSMPSYAEAAGRLSKALIGVDGALNAANEVESLLVDARKVQRHGAA